MSGLGILTLGVCFTMQSNLGTSPFDALLVGLTKNIGLTVGSWEIITSFIIIFCNNLLARKRPEFLGLLTAFVTGVCIDTWLFLLGDVLHPTHFVSKVMCQAIGLVIIGLGSAIYLQAKFAPNPIDFSMLVIRDLTGKSIMFSKTLIYILFLALAFVFGGPIGVGTVLTVFLGGPILNYFMPLIENMLVNAQQPHYRHS
ncbi:permease [Lysinibacillus sphaericus OT4b.31]|uniref:Permease n=2 Tax=Lysinibacillus sphaericus TaxID=1421 RepID=R7ZET5_LYSSH|nr:permease [Lysinibacillus sphaericus OT4b.31]